MDNEVFEILAKIAGPFIVAIFGYLSYLARTYIKNQTASGIVERFNDIVVNVVVMLGQTMASEFRDANADGKLTKDEKIRLRNRAIAIIRGYIGPKGIALLAKILGIEDIIGYIETRVETAVADRKLYRKNIEMSTVIAEVNRITAKKHELEMLDKCAMPNGFSGE